MVLQIIHKRILTITGSIYGWTGYAINERQLITHLAKKVEKCYVITFVGSEQFFTKRDEMKINMPQNTVIISIPLPFFTSIVMSCIIGIIAVILIKLRKIDFIYIRSSLYSIGILVFRSLSVKTIVKIGAMVEDELSNKGIRHFFHRKLSPYLDRSVLANSKRVAVNSEEMYHKLIKRRLFKHKLEPLEIPPGVNPSLIKKLLTQPHEKMPRNNINIGFIGSLAWWQGVDLLVRALEIVQISESSVKLFIIGDGPLREEISRISKELDIDCKITGYLPHKEALSYLKSLDIMVLPSLRLSTTDSNIPIKVIEAWALGIPVIVTRHKVFSNRYVDGEDVVFCEPHPKDIARAILFLLKDRDILLKLAKRGPELAREFSYDKIADRLLTAFLEE